MTKDNITADESIVTVNPSNKTSTQVVVPKAVIKHWEWKYHQPIDKVGVSFNHKTGRLEIRPIVK